MRPAGLRRRQSSLTISNATTTTATIPIEGFRSRSHSSSLEMKHVIVNWNNTTLKMIAKIILSCFLFVLLIEDGRTWLTRGLSAGVGPVMDAVVLMNNNQHMKHGSEHFSTEENPRRGKRRRRDWDSITSDWDGADKTSGENRPRPLVVAGPSGVGKGTLIKKLLQHFSSMEDEMNASEKEGGSFFGFSVSHTTRKPRPGEVDGVHYHFIDRESMLEQIGQNKFIEHAEVHGNLYGTSFGAIQAVTSSGRICIIDIDIQGVEVIKTKSSLDPHFIFIAPPSLDELEHRLRDRKTESEADIEQRLVNASREIEFGTKDGNFDEVIVNDDMDMAFSKLRDLVEQWYPQLRLIQSSK